MDMKVTELKDELARGEVKTGNKSWLWRGAVCTPRSCATI